jgi:hypothetical protein
LWQEETRLKRYFNASARTLTNPYLSPDNFVLLAIAPIHQAALTYLKKQQDKISLCLI